MAWWRRKQEEVSLGLFGLTAYEVSRRTAEFGLRLALGAQRSNVVLLVVGRAVLLVGCGAGIGLLSAIAVMRITGRLVYGGLRVRQEAGPSREEARCAAQRAFARSNLAGDILVQPARAGRARPSDPPWTLPRRNKTVQPLLNRLLTLARKL